VPATWFECTVEVPVEYAEIVANFLIDSGAPGLQSEEGDGFTLLTGYFSDEPSVAGIERFCAHIGCALRNAGSIRVRPRPQEDWAENWKVHFRPHAVGNRLYICPPWDRVALPGRATIVINPGMAFGTGQHATTRGCLLLLGEVVADRRVQRALDVGTGSGVLAIALATLGVSEVWAIDIDAAVRAIAQQNVACNGVEAQVHIGSSLEDVSGRFDLIAANLFANLLEQMAVRLPCLLAPAGTLICSGFLTTDEPKVRAAYESSGLHLAQRHVEQPWVTVGLRRSVQL
jgi:ribosomal protein L11 methyltransferase